MPKSEKCRPSDRTGMLLTVSSPSADERRRQLERVEECTRQIAEIQEGIRAKRIASGGDGRGE